jgi:hypothetical protein
VAYGLARGLAASFGWPGDSGQLEAERAGLIESLSGDESGCLGEVVEGCVVGAFSSAEFGRAGWALDLGVAGSQEAGVALVEEQWCASRCR